MHTVAIIQARTGSTRLPNKVLEVIHGKRVIDWVISRTKQCELLNQVCLATTFLPEDNILEDVARGHGVVCVRGPVDDVLDRFVRAAKTTDASTIIRLTADNPFVGPNEIRNLYCDYNNNHAEYGTSYVATSEKWPDGMDAEVFSVEELCHAGFFATLNSDREHVTPFIRRKYEFATDRIYIDPFMYVNGKAQWPNLGHHRWTIDEPRDLEFARAVFPLLPENFRYTDVIKVLEEHPKLAKINSGIMRNEGYYKSLMEDKKDESS